MVLVERDYEIDVLKRRILGCADGESSVTLISGASGTGKTALLHAAGEMAADSDAFVLTAYGNRSGEAEPLETISQMFGGFELGSGGQEQLAALLAEGRDAFKPADHGGAGPAHIPADVSEALFALLTQAVDGRPLVLLVDDVHLVDVASRQWLIHLTRHLNDMRLMLVLGDCGGSDPVSPVFHTDLLRLPSYQRLTLRPVSPAGVRHMVQGLADGDGAYLAAEFHRITGGNPLMLRALTQDQITSSAVPGTLFRQAVFACLCRAHPQVRRTAETVALLGDSATVEMVAKLLERSEREVSVDLETLSAMGLLDGARCRHPDTRVAILQGCGERTRLHASVARFLYREGAPVPAVAEHLLASGRADEPWQFQVLETAANVARDPEKTAAYLELTYRESEDAEHRAKLALRMVGNTWRTSPATVVRTLPRLEQQGGENVESALTLVAHQFWSGNAETATALLDRAIECASDEQAVAGARVVRRWLGTLCPAVQQEKYAPQEPVEAQTAALQAHRAVAALHDVLHGADRADCAARAQEVLCDLWLEDGVSVYAALAALSTLVHAERPDAAAVACDRLLEESARHRGRRALLSVVRADIALRQGDLPTAGRMTRWAWSNLPVLHWGVLSGHLQGIRIAVAVGSGDLVQAQALAGSPVPDALFETCYGMRYLCLRGQYYLAAGQPRAALSDFLLVGRLAERWEIMQPSIAEWRTGAAEAHIALGERGQARSLIKAQLALLAPDDHRVRAGALRVRSALLEPGDRATCLREAAGAAKKGGDRLELARIMSELHDACRTAGETDLAKVAALQTLKLADECQAGPLQRKFAALRPPASSEKNSSAPVGLTASELRVAALAARGHTNREIAGKLHVTMSTVEQHLTKVYRKLNVRHRKELVVRIEEAV